MRILSNTAYEASSDRAIDKGSFPLYEADKYIDSGFIKKLPPRLRDKIKQQGIRNSHLISIAPTGTISFCADNISSGLEPVFMSEVDRTVNTELGTQIVKLKG